MYYRTFLIPRSTNMLCRLLAFSLVASAFFLPDHKAAAYTTLLSGTYDTPFTFTNNQTYYIPGAVTFTKTLYFQPNCVIKYAPGAILKTEKRVQCDPSMNLTDSTAILTSKDDNTCGENISGTTGNPQIAASTALWVEGDQGSQYWGLDIRWANTALYIRCQTPGDSRYVNVVRVSNCFNGIWADACNIVTQNSEHYNVSVPAAVSNGGYVYCNGAFTRYGNVVGGKRFTFASGMTYYVSGNVTFTGTLTFQPDCVVKFGPGASLTSSFRAMIQSELSSPIVLTSQDDNTCGETISGSTGSPNHNAWQGFTVTPQGSQSFNGMEIRWANTGFTIVDTPANGHYVYAKIKHCTTGLLASGSTICIQGQSSYGDVSTPTYTTGGGYFYIEGMGGSWTCTGEDLQDHMVAGMQSLMSGHTAPTDELVWSNSNTYNLNCWLNGVTGLSSASLGVHNPVSEQPYTYASCAVLITRRHAIVASHSGGGGVNTYHAFVGTDNVQYNGFVGANAIVSIPGTDISVIRFENEIDSHVEIAKILPSSLMSKLPADMNYTPLHARVPFVGENQFHQAFSIDMTDFWLSAGTPCAWFDGYGSGQWFPSWFQPAIGGDSSHPVYGLIQNELCLLGTWWYGTPNAGTSYCPNNIGAINAAIASFGDYGYSVTTKDLSAFTDY